MLIADHHRLPSSFTYIRGTQIDHTSATLVIKSKKFQPNKLFNLKPDTVKDQYHKEGFTEICKEKKKNPSRIIEELST